jgi:hypothetical protein
MGGGTDARNQKTVYNKMFQQQVVKSGADAKSTP